MKENEKIDSSEISDGFHTFGELYEFRKFYNAGMFNLLKIHEMPTVKFDVIFCQNVLIYFTKEKKLKILDGLKRFLKIGGILVLSPTDIAYWKSENMTRITYKGTLAYNLTR